MSHKLAYSNDGYLFPGLISMTRNEFIDEFCMAPDRIPYLDAIHELFKYAEETGGVRIIIGGSFLCKNKKPHDIDCMIVYSLERAVEKYLTCKQSDSISYDILFGSVEHRGLVDAFITLMGTERLTQRQVGVIEVRVQESLLPWDEPPHYGEYNFDIIQELYYGRNYLQRSKRVGLLVLIHGLRTNAAWFSSLTPYANSKGWLVAPFIYDNPWYRLIKGRGVILDQFRDWIYNLTQKYQVSNLSVVSHSYGTYIITRYINSFSHEDYLPVTIDSLVLTGGIVRHDYPWSERMPRQVKSILNVYTDKDQWAARMRLIKDFDDLYGCCGCKKIISNHPNIVNMERNIANHCNLFRNDFIEKDLIPFIDERRTKFFD